jgi:outer membrane protein OmpA-like peptidoglycan-associated protein
MTKRLMLVAGVLLCSVSAHAQAGPTSLKSAEDITCELTGDCEKVDSSLANKDAGRSRGFSIRRQNGSSTATAIAPRPANVIAQPMRGTGRRAVAPGSRAIARAPFARVAPGRSNLAVGFVTGSAQLDTAGRAQAGKLLEALRGPSLTDKKILVAGHTDSVGSRAYNLDLSRRRADSLIDYLVQNGVDRSRLQARGFGFDQPLPGTSAKAAVNRRVEISVAN